MMQRIPFGLDRLPRNLAPDDPRLPGVTVGSEPLRFNTEPLPAEAMAAATPDHASRLAAMQHYLYSLCGNYAPVRLRFVDAYIAALGAHIAAHRTALATDLARYDGLYAPEDWLWSALRPLPRAWLHTDAGSVGVDFAFWDGAQAIAIDLTGTLSAESITIHRLTSAVLDADPSALAVQLPELFRPFWVDEKLPRSPFRRAIPPGVIGAAV